MVTDRWSRKIVALLHDPPDKPFAIYGHEGRAAELTQIALGRAANTDEINRAKHADRIASAADRVNFPERDAQGEYLSAYWQRQQAILTHPLAGRAIDLGMMADVDVRETHEAALRAVGRLMEGVTDTQIRFLQLWRQLPETLAEEYRRVGTLFKVLPAETRQPDHSLPQHLSIAAAIADALPQPALLIFSIGPVQEFIAAARRTQDLWMGSWLLSYLSWQAMKSLAETFGPDVIIFPSLRGQPLCDLWLHGKIVAVRKPGGDALAFASLPNRFVALLPASEAQRAAQHAQETVQKAWQQLAERVFNALAKNVMPDDAVTRQMWQEQIARQWEIYWVIWPWAGANQEEGKMRSDAVKTQFESVSFEGTPPEEWSFGRLYTLFAKPKERGGGQYQPNWGTTYSLLYNLADRAFNARKALRDFEQTEEVGEKCTVCGQQAALHGQDGGRQGVRDFWSRVANNLKSQRRHVEVKSEGRERLCAICTIKRFMRREVLECELGISGDFPSTAEIAVACFKEGILQKLGDEAYGQQLADALGNHIETLQLLDTRFPHTVALRAIPRLTRALEGVPTSARKYAEECLRFDGEAFFAETLTPERLKDYGLNVSENDACDARESLGNLLKAAAEVGIPRPPKYYALLHMDGDHAGRWLSGTHEGLACFSDVLHPDVKRQLEGQSEWAELLRQKRIITPALHATISEALASFALHIVRWVVEERHAGRVVYAGGDDVLAFLPLDHALSAARELRALFSGQVKHRDALVDLMPGDDLPVDFGDDLTNGYVLYRKVPPREILLTMGPTASASIGITIAHYMQPLDIALRAVREAEHDAKELYGRNALCVYLLKRSGEEIRVGTRWFYPEANCDASALVMDICERFRDGRLSMKAAHVVFEEAPTLAELPLEAQQAELKRLLKRHAEKLPSEEREEQAEELSTKLGAFANELDKCACEVSKRGFEQMAEWLLLARFLAQGGEE